MSQLECLVGKVIRAVYVSECDTYLNFHTDDGAVVFEATGDCCSHSYFAELLGVEEVLEREVTSVEDMGMDARNDDAEHKVYGYKVHAGMRSMTIIFRNDSNGYYGGSLWRVDYGFEGTLWREVTTDWTATGVA